MKEIKLNIYPLIFFPGYIYLAKKLFKYADISIDRFHIVVQYYVALNATRVKLCNKNNPNYNKLKDYWKLILKNENELTEEKHYSKHFHKDISQKEIVQYLINTNENLKYIENSFKHDINNGIVERTNNLIKCLKRLILVIGNMIILFLVYS